MNNANTLKKNLTFKGVARFQNECTKTVMTKISKHFSHRVPVKNSEGITEIQFYEGSCYMSFENNLIRFNINSNNENDFFAVKETLERHLPRFSKSSNEILWSYR